VHTRVSTRSPAAAAQSFLGQGELPQKQSLMVCRMSPCGHMHSPPCSGSTRDLRTTFFIPNPLETGLTVAGTGASGGGSSGEGAHLNSPPVCKRAIL